MNHLDYQQQDAWQYTASTNQQSPIDIEDYQTQTRPAQEVVFDFDPQQVLQPKSSVSGLQFYCQGTVTFNQQVWQMERFHFHDGAEHLHNGQRYDLELHLVLKGPARTRVLAIWGQVDLAIPAVGLAELFEKQAINLNFKRWLPTAHGYYDYLGTLTTPPLQDEVEWMVLDVPLRINPTDLAAVHQNFADNHRKIQPLAGRTVAYVPAQFSFRGNHQ